MSDVTFASRAWDEYLYWQKTDKKTLKRINILIKETSRNGNDGIGKPEILRHRNAWSRRIDDFNRLVYQLKQDGSIVILQCKGHYDDK